VQEMEEEAAAKRARKAAESHFLQLLKDNTPPEVASISPRESTAHSTPWHITGIRHLHGSCQLCLPLLQQDWKMGFGTIAD